MTQICCDLTKRLFNDVHYLTGESEAAARQAIWVGQAEAALSELAAEMDARLAATLAANAPGTEAHAAAVDFVCFARMLHRALLCRLSNTSRHAVCVSNGVSVRQHLEEITELVLDLEKCLSLFVHKNCYQLFTSLAAKVKDEMYPDLESVDALEAAATYLNAAMPGVGRVVALVEAWAATPGGGATPLALLHAATAPTVLNLTPGWFRTAMAVLEPEVPDPRPSVTHSSSHLPRHAVALADEILPTPPSPPILGRPRWASLTNAPIRRVRPQVFPTPPPPPPPPPHYQGRRNKYRKRVPRPPGKWSENADLGPLRIPHLALPPID